MTLYLQRGTRTEHDMSDSIQANVRRVLAELPTGVELVVAAKTRTPEEVQQAVEAGASIVGENYVREAKTAYEVVGTRARWHFIGTLSAHAVRRSMLQMFDMIETVDSIELAKEIDRKCAPIEKVMPVLIEVNSGREAQKSGALPEDVERLVRDASGLHHVEVQGLMTMGPFVGEPDDFRPYFRVTKDLFDRLAALGLPNVDMRYLSMGMTQSYRVAIEEGANLVRIGTAIFGERNTGS
ncbi:MAG: YggS family pyridoxal phosphate-dependent enzyme [Chloroflexota bacterium]